MAPVMDSTRLTTRLVHNLYIALYGPLREDENNTELVSDERSEDDTNSCSEHESASVLRLRQILSDSVRFLETAT